MSEPPLPYAYCPAMARRVSPRYQHVISFHLNSFHSNVSSLEVRLIHLLLSYFYMLVFSLRIGLSSTCYQLATLKNTSM